MPNPLDPRTYTVEEAERWSHLRAIEWSSFVAFLLPLYGPPLVLAVGVGQALAIVAAVHLLWAFVLRPWMPIYVPLSVMAALAVNYLQWPIALVAAAAAGFTAHDWVAAVVILVLPWQSGLVGFVEVPVWWVVGAFKKNAFVEATNKSGIGVIQRRLLSQIGWTVNDQPGPGATAPTSEAAVGTDEQPDPSSTLERSYWRHAVFAASLFAVLSSIAADGILAGTLVVLLCIVGVAALPHVRGREAHGIHRGVRRLLGWIGTVLVGLDITALAIGLVLVLVGRSLDWGFFIFQGLFGLGYVIFTTHLFKTAVQPSGFNPTVKPTTADLMSELKARVEAAQQAAANGPYAARQKLIADVVNSTSAVPKSGQPAAGMVDGGLIDPGLDQVWVERGAAEAVWNALIQSDGAPVDRVLDAERKGFRLWVYAQPDDDIAAAKLLSEPTSIRTMLSDGLAQFVHGQYNRYVLTQMGRDQIEVYEAAAARNQQSDASF